MRTIKIIIGIIVIIINHSVLAQRPDPGKNREAMKKFDFIVGEWEGSGKYFRQDGALDFTVTESVTTVLDGTAIKMEGIGKNSEGEEVHNALGILYLNAQGKAELHAFLATGQSTMANIELVDDNGFDWWFEIPDQGKVIYRARFNGDTWTENGYFQTTDGKEYPSMTMTLKRK